jgi:hypothetical protein
VADAVIRVECYCGYRGDERPVRVFFGEQGIEVTSVEDRWYSPGFTYFRVLLTTGERYVLRHQEAQDLWTIEAFRAAGTRVDSKINSSV